MYKIKNEFIGRTYHQIKRGGVITFNDNLSQEELEMLYNKNHPAVVKARVVKKKEENDTETDGEGSL